MDIDYKLLLKNVEEMIKLLEYDSMRSTGKTKINSQHLHSLHYLRAVYKFKIRKEEERKKK